MLAGTQTDTLTSLPLYLGEKKNYSRLTVDTNCGIPAFVALTAARYAYSYVLWNRVTPEAVIPLHPPWMFTPTF